MAIDLRQGLAKRYGQLVARAWGDEAFKARLLAEPATALAEYGVELPPGLEVRVHADTATLVHLALPPAPPEELSDEQLDAVAGAGGTTTTYCQCVPPEPYGSVSTMSSYQG
jgi:hypothetical protein